MTFIDDTSDASSSTYQFLRNRHNRQHPRTLNRRGEPTLVLTAHPGAATRQDLRRVGDEPAQHSGVVVVRHFLFAGAKGADLGAATSAASALNRRGCCLSFFLYLVPFRKVNPLLVETPRRCPGLSYSRPCDSSVPDPFGRPYSRLR